MASIYKKKGRKKWIIEYFDHEGRRRRVTGFTDRQATVRHAAQLEHEADLRRRGVIDPRQEHLAANQKRQLIEHLRDFENHLEAKGSTTKHVNNTIAYIRSVSLACGFSTAADVEAGKVSEHLAQLLRAGISARAVNARLTAMKSFSRWLFMTDRVRSDPLKCLRRDVKLERIDRRHQRRALTGDEQRRLITAAQLGPRVGALNGRDRAMLYRLALGTGLRASELASLTPASFDLADLDNASVCVKAAYSKHRRDDILPLRPDLAEQMAAYIAGKPADAPLFGVPDKPGRMLKLDLAAAGIPYRTDEGVVDFHSLRHTFITTLVRSGVSPAVAKTLARHSTITLTIDRYTHTLVADQRAALASLPKLPETPDPASQRATGTLADGAETCPHFCPQSRFTEGHRVASIDTVRGVGRSGNQLSPGAGKSFGQKPLDSSCHVLSPPVSRAKKTAPPGIRTPDPLIKSQLLYQLS